MSALRILTSVRENISRIAVTLTMLAVFVAGMRIPFPILPQSAVTDTAGPYLFLLGNGVQAWLEVIAVLELFLLAFPGQRHRSWVQGNHVNPFARTVVVSATIWTSALTYIGVRSLWLYLEGGAGPDWMDALLICATAAAALVVTVMLAGMIESLGVGYGFWLLVLWMSLMAFARDLATAFASGAPPDWRQFALVAALAIAMVIFVRLMRGTSRAKTFDAAWSVFMATVFAPLLLGFGLVLMMQVAGSTSPLVQDFYKIGFVPVNALTAMVFVWLYSHRGQQGGAVAGAIALAGLATVAAALPVAGVFAPETPLDLSFPKFVLAAAFASLVYDEMFGASGPASGP